MMSSTPGVEFEFHVKRTQRGRKVIKSGPAAPAPSSGGVPRIAHLMALAIKMEQMVRSGEVSSYAELARRGNVTRARMSQIVDLLNLAPGLQEALLLLPGTVRGGVNERSVREIVRESDWCEQKQRWVALTRKEVPHTARRCQE